MSHDDSLVPRQPPGRVGYLPTPLNIFPSNRIFVEPGFFLFDRPEWRFRAEKYLSLLLTILNYIKVLPFIQRLVTVARWLNEFHHSLPPPPAFPRSKLIFSLDLSFKCAFTFAALYLPLDLSSRLYFYVSHAYLFLHLALLHVFITSLCIFYIFIVFYQFISL